MNRNKDMKNNSLVARSSQNLPEPIKSEVPQRSFAADVFHRQSEDAAHLKEFLFSLRKYWLLVVGIPLLVTALVAVYMARQPSIYEAMARVQVDLENSSPTLGSSKGGTYVVNPVNDPAYFNTQLQILTSPRLLRRVVRDLDLEHDPNFKLPNSTPSRWQKLFGEPARSVTPVVNQTAVSGDEDLDSPREDLAEATRLAPYVEALKTNLKAEPVKEVRLLVKDTRLIDLSFSYPNPQLATKIVNRIAETFVLSNLERKTANNQSTGEVFQQRITDLRTQIKDQETQLLNYAKNHQILSLDAAQNTVVERLTNLNRQLLEAENERKVAEAAYQAALAPGAADALASGGAGREPNDIEARLSQLVQRRSQLMVDFTPAWPEVKEIDNQIAVLEGQLKQTRNRASSVVVTNLSTHYRQSMTRERSLRSAFNEQRAETLEQNEAAVNYRILQQEIETNRLLLEGMLQRSKENEAALASMRNNIHVGDYAVIPSTPVGPKRMLFVGIAFALSFLVGIGLAVLLGFLDDSFRSTDDLERTLNLRALTAIPSTNGKLLLGAANGNGANGDGKSGEDPSPEVNHSLPFREAYRQLRTSMLLSSRRGGFKSLLVASSMPGEGRTTIAVNTALSLSRTGALVLLIDADLRQPNLHSFFDLENENGLTTLLSNGLNENDPLQFIQHSEKGIGILTAGPIFDDSAELLGTERMRDVIETLQSIYDYVIIDSPPINFFTDAVLISSLVDRAVLVVDSSKTSRETVKRSAQLLHDAGAPTLGIVLNNVREPRQKFKKYAAPTTQYAEA
ncbi:MAG TPA: polysaccharide biosynthesis tyrosine autokinase [Pyrinomonadaceae bacterium]|nr:polysaccharide biosynthesis tyrosine autokinase [Pyrinomonadaceae bacterium]